MADTQTLNALRRRYSRIYDTCEDFADQCKRILNARIEKKKLKVQAINPRAKSVESFIKKASKKHNGVLKYDEPFEQIEDICGVRVICYLPSDIRTIEEAIDESFDIQDIEDKDEQRAIGQQFGYSSKHFIVKLNRDRALQDGNEDVVDMICEIQVRTVLQHAWAEIDHRIRYKADQPLPKLQHDAFATLAGLLQLADREFQRIQDFAEASKKEAALELVEVETEVAKDTRSKYTSEATKSSAKKSSRILKGKNEEGLSAKELMEQKRYDEAIEVYDELIKNEPISYTPYLGRARAKLLLNDPNGSLEDINKAEELKGIPGAFQKIRLQIEFGSVKSDNSGKIPRQGQIGIGQQMLYPGKAETQVGLKLLSAGKPIEAFESFSISQDQGYNFAFSVINKAMAKCLAGDLASVNVYLSSLEYRRGTPTAVIMSAIKAICAGLDDDEGEFNIKMEELVYALNELGNFSLIASPLKCLQEGFAARDQPIHKNVQKVFEVIANAD